MSTPLQISIALHYWTRATDYGRDGDCNFNAPAVHDQRGEMIGAGLLIHAGPEDPHGRKFAPGPAARHGPNNDGSCRTINDHA